MFGMAKWLALLLLVAGPVHAQVTTEAPWARATVPGARVAGGYLTVRNESSLPDRLVGASSPIAVRIEFHLHIADGEIMRMRQVQALDVPANGFLALKPGAAHLMFVDIREPFKEGDVVPVTLRFDRAGELTVHVPVAELGAKSPPHRAHP